MTRSACLLLAVFASVLAPAARAQIAQIMLLNPPDGATGLAAPPNRFVDLSWTPISGVDGYKLQVSRVATFQSNDLDVRTVGGSFGAFRFQNAPESTTFYWRVAGYTQNGAIVGPWSEVRTFATYVDPVRVTEAPALQAPAQDAAVSVGAGPTAFAWGTAANATGFEGQVFLSTNTLGYRLDFSTFASGTAPPTATAMPLLGGATLFWRVRGTRNNGPGPWSALASFTTGSLAAPAPTSPAPGETAANPVRFAFARPPGVTYDGGTVQVYAGAAVRPDSLVRTLTGQPAAATTDVRLVQGRTYTWRVKIDDYNETQPDTVRVPVVSAGNAWSAPVTFTVGAFTIRDMPTLASPGDAATSQNRPFLQATALAGFSTEFEARAGAAIVFRGTAAPTTSSSSGVTAAGLPPDATVVWRARYRERSGPAAIVGPWSPERTFTTGALDATLPVPVLVSPDDGATAARGPRVAFVYTLDTAVANGELQISRTAGFTDVVAAPAFSSTAEGLPEGVVLYWRARATDRTTQRPGAWSAARSFTKAPTARIASLSPASGPYGTRVTITGTGFGPDPAAHAVAFNGVRAAVEAGPGGALVATVPVGATTGPVVLALDGGASAGPRFAVTSGPTLTLTAASFSSAPLLDSPTAALRAAAAADFDGDGLVDLATDTDGQTVEIRRSLGGSPATLAAPERYAFAGGARPIAQILATDYDSDGQPDLVVLFEGPTAFDWSFLVLANRSTPGTLAFETVNGGDAYPGRIDAADATGDGRPDLVFGARAVQFSGRPLVYANGYGEPRGTLRLGAANETVPSTAFGDLDGDGWADVAVVDDAGAVSAYRNAATGGLAAGAFGPAVTTAPARAGATNAGIAAGDLTGDGRADVVVALPEAGALAVYASAGVFGAFAAPVIIDLGTGSMPRYPRVSDVDGDGRPDILAETSAGVVLVQTLAPAPRGSSVLALGAPIRLDAGAPGVGAGVGDADGDGALDVLVVTASGVRLFRGTVAVADAPGAAALVFGIALAGPNPARAATALRLTLAAAGRARLVLFDVLGREVARPFEAEAPAGARVLPLDVSGLAPGVYVARLVSSGASASVRLTVAR